MIGREPKWEDLVPMADVMPEIREDSHFGRRLHSESVRSLGLLVFPCGYTMLRIDIVDGSLH
jgi:hypothetical protein